MRILMTALVACLLAAPAVAQSSGEQPFRVFFDWGKPELSRDAQATLDEIVSAYQRQPAGMMVAGHADRSGPVGANLAASRRRAQAVESYLIAHGIPANAISVSAFGESTPIIATADGVREGQNRRVEISWR